MSKSHKSGAQVTTRQLRPTTYPSVHELARAFGSVVFEPEWWPQDTGGLTYELFETNAGPRYHIGSVRTDGAPIFLIGQNENLRARLPEENWYEPPEIKPLGGMVAETGAGFRAVLRQEQQTVQLIGYLTEAEVLRAVLSVNRVMP